MKRSEVDRFEKLLAQLEALYSEISLLSKKSPNDALSKFKLGFVNSLLTESNDFLGDRYKPFDGFTVFDADAVPVNSDVVLMLAQYIGCFEKYRKDHVVIRNAQWFWRAKPDEGDVVNGDGWVYVRTKKPAALRE